MGGMGPPTRLGSGRRSLLWGPRAAVGRALVGRGARPATTALTGAARRPVRAGAQPVPTDPAGTFALSLAVTLPPTPCPCVVMAFDVALATTPPTVPVHRGRGGPGPTTVADPKPLQVRRAALEGAGPWTS